MLDIRRRIVIVSIGLLGVVAVGYLGLWMRWIDLGSDPLRLAILSLPSYFIVVACCYAAVTVGVGLMRFPECPEAYFELKKDLVRVKAALGDLGFVPESSQATGSTSS
mmetsp:Transcript_17037/g.35399  ORF Transcript_17037/g.35399 Transcript_17037/m.35399 type:complete len:108 (-) Transcript_17037:131-454(-)